MFALMRVLCGLGCNCLLFSLHPRLERPDGPPERWKFNVCIDFVRGSGASMRMPHERHTYVLNHACLHQARVECVPKVFEEKRPNLGVLHGCLP